MFGFAGFSLSFTPTGRAVVGMKDTNAHLGGAVAVNAFAGITADLSRPWDTDGPEFNAVNAMLGKRRVCGVREPRQRCGSGSDGSATQECATVYRSLDHRVIHFALDDLSESM